MYLRQPLLFCCRSQKHPREAAFLVQQYLSTSPRSHHDIVSGGGALKRGKRAGTLMDDPEQAEDAGAGTLRVGSTPVSDPKCWSWLAIIFACCACSGHIAHV